MSLLTDLIAHWKLNEASGTRFDSHGSNDLTDNNTVGSATGKIGDAADFERSNSEHLNCLDNADLSLGSDTSFTIALWINVESIQTFTGIIGKITDYSGNADEWGVDFNGSSRLRLLVGNGVSFTSASWSSASSTGVWYFVVAWHDATANTINISVNNGTPVSSAHSGGTQNTAGQFRIGYFSAGAYFDGLVDSVSFWKRVLTSDERTALYNSGDGLDYEDFGDAEPTTYDEELLLSAVGSVEVSGLLDYPQTSTLTGVPSLVLAQTVTLTGLLSLETIPTFIIDALVDLPLTSALSAIPTVTCDHTYTLDGSATLSGVAAFTLESGYQTSITVSLSNSPEWQVTETVSLVEVEAQVAPRQTVIAYTKTRVQSTIVDMGKTRASAFPASRIKSRVKATIV